MNTGGQRAAWLRGLVGASQRQIAGAVGTSQQALNQFEKNETRQPRYLSRLARVFGVSLDWLEDGRGAKPSAAQVRRHYEATGAALRSKPGMEYRTGPASLEAIPEQIAGPRMEYDVEVRGTAVGGPDHDFSFYGGIIDHVRRPPGLLGAKDIFAMFVVGESMAPRYEEGELIYLHPGRPARAGDDVVIELQGPNEAAGGALLKRLVQRSGNHLSLAQFNPPRENIRVPNSRVKRILRVVTRSELVGA